MDFVTKLKNKIVTHDYCVCYRKKVSDNILNTNESFKMVPSNNNYWYADPFVVDINDKSYIFCEQYDKRKHIGNIALFELNNNKISKPTTIIDEPFHMSFPNVFKFNNDFYMIPETSADKSIRIYKMLDNPYKWECIKQHKIESAVDTAVYKEENNLILFISKIKKENELYTKTKIYKILDFPCGDLQYIRDFDEEYSIVSRNGGNILNIGNEYFRVIQNSTETYYGKSLTISKINLKDFNETRIKNIEVKDLYIKGNYFHNYKIIGTHTYNTSSKYEVIDISAFKISLLRLF